MRILRFVLIAALLSACAFGHKRQFEPDFAKAQALYFEPKEKTASGEDSPTLDDFITKTVADARTNGSDEFVLLTNELLNDGNFMSNDSGLILDEDSKREEIAKMQRLASYISQEYDVPLYKAEVIVYSTFVESQKKNLEPLLVLSLIDVESTFRQYSKSSVGAVGLTQVMPGVHRKKIMEENVNVWTINGNIRVGTDILNEYVKMSKGNIRRALQMYNGSLGDGTWKYSNKVIRRMRDFATAEQSES